MLDYLTNNFTLEADPNVNLAIWILVGVITMSNVGLVIQCGLSFTKLRLVCVLAGLFTLMAAIANALREHNAATWELTTNLFAFGSVIYVNLLVVIFLQIGQTLRLRRQDHQSIMFWFIIFCAGTFSIGAIIYILYFDIHGIGIDNPVFYNVVFLLCLFFGVFATFGGAIYTFMPLILTVRNRDFGPKLEAFAIGIWYFTGIFILILVFVVFYAVAVAYNSAFYPLCSIIDLTIRTLILLFYALPPPAFVTCLAYRFLKPRHLSFQQWPRRSSTNLIRRRDSSSPARCQGRRLIRSPSAAHFRSDSRITHQSDRYPVEMSSRYSSTSAFASISSSSAFSRSLPRLCIRESAMAKFNLEFARGGECQREKVVLEEDEKEVVESEEEEEEEEEGKDMMNDGELDGEKNGEKDGKSEDAGEREERGDEKEGRKGGSVYYEYF